MKIYSMTATFGKLEHETITLVPGLNVIHAPNEWGKSTWCAFLLSMLYGIDTSARETKGILPDKTKYAPWSGKPMSGSMDIAWNGRNITLQRGPKGRIPFGDFQAFETETGLPVPELTAANCGQQLLGVERSVFTRTGFLRLTDMPVTQDEALRRRLNALVTTGDESGAADDLAQKLKDLKNRCRHNKTGLLPTAEEEAKMLQDKLSQLEQCQKQMQSIHQRQQALDETIRLLENHRVALDYADAQKHLESLKSAEDACTQAQAKADRLTGLCAALPDRLEAANALEAGRQLILRQQTLAAKEASLPTLPEQAAQIPDLEAILSAARTDHQQYQALEKYKKKNTLLIRLYLAFAGCLAILLAVLAVLSLATSLLTMLVGGTIALGGLAVLLTCYLRTDKYRRQIHILFQRHPGTPPAQWIPEAEATAARLGEARKKAEEISALRQSFTLEKQILQKDIQVYADAAPLSSRLEYWEQVIKTQDALEAALQELKQAQKYAQLLQGAVKPVEAPAFPDNLTCSAAQTQQQLQSIAKEQQQLQRNLGQYQGQMALIGQAEALNRQLAVVQTRISRLEDIYSAATLAQKALADATTELQRRFAPRITQRTQSLFRRLTGGRYTRLTIGQDLSLQVAAQDQDTLCTAQYPSDGTVDQLYLALRLAVSQELTPDAPLILDDALVRFDEDRLKIALEILREFAQNQQILLFSCQKRESLS